MRSTAGRPAPRSSAGGERLATAAWRRWRGHAAGGDAAPARAAPIRRAAGATGSPERRTLATASTASASGPRRGAAGGDRRRPPRRPRTSCTSAGRISVATCPGGPHGGGDRLGGVGRPTLGRGLRRADPRRHVAGHGLDVGLELGVVLLVVGGVVADDVDDRHARPCGRCGGWPARCPAPGPRCSSVAAGRPAMRA